VIGQWPIALHLPAMRCKSQMRCKAPCHQRVKCHAILRLRAASSTQRPTLDTSTTADISIVRHAGLLAIVGFMVLCFGAGQLAIIRETLCALAEERRHTA
jgi:hypothetical protein